MNADTTKSTIENVAMEVTKAVLFELTPIVNQQQDMISKIFDMMQQQQDMKREEKNMMQQQQHMIDSIVSHMDTIENTMTQKQEELIDEISFLKSRLSVLEGAKSGLDNNSHVIKTATAISKDISNPVSIGSLTAQKQLLFDQKRLMQERRKLFEAQEEQYITNIVDTRNEFSKLRLELQQKVEVLPENLRIAPPVQDIITLMNLKFTQINSKLLKMETTNNEKDREILAKNAEIAQKEKEILKQEKEMSIDPLTGLYNVGYLNHVVANEDGRWVGITIDLDNFKRINDLFGHAEGDRVLKETAKCIHEAAAAMSDTNRKIYIFRRGGDEMAVLVKCRQRSEGYEELDFAMKLAEEIRERVEKKGDVTVSVGVGGTLLDTPCDRQLFEQHKDEVLGDKAAYESKNSGRNKVSGPMIQLCIPGVVVTVIGGVKGRSDSEDRRQEEAMRSLKDLAKTATISPSGTPGF